MSELDGQYSGAALHSFIRGLERSQTLIDRILKAHGLDGIDEDAWYPLETARSIFMAVGEQVGDVVLHAVGMKIMESARLPPEIKDPKGALASLNTAYRMNVRGSDIGYIATTFEDEHSAIIHYATPLFPCAACRGVVQGCFKKFGQRALLEHGTDGCMDRGAPLCTFHITW
ncbi:hypothetical protein BE21_23850 [Sorangium cellulosum]|uniref:4-vinyl reductase 4VR domain-containing protein n=1 Tax=Sorangium cellulosum TaxID=56 RepID=A0A150TUN0_SORCE|nr:hypothetical protein BE21_23850 [Sorangium cellulosum]